MKLWRRYVAWKMTRKFRSFATRSWDERYSEAMRWRDWQTCDQLFEERYGERA